MTLGEALSKGLQTTVIGLVIVFGVLAVLMIVLILMKKIFYKEPAKKAQQPMQAAKPAPAAPAAVKEELDDAELIAVLTAAVAASLNTSTYNLHIKSYRRLDSHAPAWNQAGLQETINSRF